MQPFESWFDKSFALRFEGNGQSDVSPDSDLAANLAADNLFDVFDMCSLSNRRTKRHRARIE